jgi:putative ABC transport system permease protein
MTQTVDAYSAYGEDQAVVSTPDGPTRIIGLAATPPYFGIFGVQPLMGRTFDEGEALPGGPKVVVLSEPLWREQFGGDAAMLGRSVTFDGIPRQVIGILPASFTLGRSERFWIPERVAPERKPPGPSGEWNGYSVVARRRAGITLEAVRAEVAIVMDRLKQERYDGYAGTPVVMTLHERRHGETRRPLLLLFGAVGVLLLTAARTSPIWRWRGRHGASVNSRCGSRWGRVAGESCASCSSRILRWPQAARSWDCCS